MGRPITGYTRQQLLDKAPQVYKVRTLDKFIENGNLSEHTELPPPPPVALLDRDFWKLSIAHCPKVL